MNDWLTWAFRGVLGLLAAYVVTLTGTVQQLETDQATMTERFAGYVESRALIVQESAKDRAQLNSRVAALEQDRVVMADVLARLRAIEELLRVRLPDQRSGR